MVTCQNHKCSNNVTAIFGIILDSAYISKPLKFKESNFIYLELKNIAIDTN